MSPSSPSFRLLTAALLGLASAGACGAAMPEGDAVGNEMAPGNAEELARKKREDSQKEPPEQKEQKPQCPHGELSDPHRGFVRCLKPEEADAGWIPPAPQPEPASPDAGSDAGAVEEKPKEKTPPPPPEEKPEAKPQPPPLVTVGAPKFQGGEIPRAEKFLNGLLEGIGKCVAEHGGMKAEKGKLSLSFLVRARGRAEGVEIENAKGIGEDASGCIRLLVKNRAVGAPSADPVGVTVTFSFEKAKQ